MCTAASLPFFLFTLPASTLVEKVNPKLLLYVTNLWLAASAGGLAIAGWMHMLNPYLLLAGVFLTSVGFAFNSPAWTAIQPQIVSDEELPSSAALGGLQLYISGIIGPTISGFLLPWTGMNVVFAFNSCCFLLLIPAIPQLRQKNLVENIVLSAVRNARSTPMIRLVLFQIALFAFFISVIPALLPIVAKKELKLDSWNLGLAFSCMGIGSVMAAATFLPWARLKFSSKTIILLASFLAAFALLFMMGARVPQVFSVGACLAGAAWTMAASELWIAAQLAIPSWARGRVNPTLITAAQGSIALGGVIWGYSSGYWGVSVTLLAAAALLMLTLVPFIWLSIGFMRKLDFEPSVVSGSAHNLVQIPHPHDGPIAIVFEFEVDQPNSKKFRQALREVRAIYLRNGACGWLLQKARDRSNAYRVDVTVPSWTQYLLEQERLTTAEKQAIDKAWSFHDGKTPPETRHLFCMERVPHTRRHPVTRPSSMPEAPLSVDRLT